MREYKRKEKPVIHSTQTGYWLDCPMKRLLTEQYSKEDESDATKKGKLFEGYVLGFVKDSEDEIRGLDPNNKAKGMREKTVQPLREWAEKLKTYFEGCEPFKKIEYETEEYILQIEVDAYKPNELLDLKQTSSIFRYWCNRFERKDFLQSIFYSYVVWKKMGVIMPFKYVITESPHLIKTITIRANQADFDWIEDIIEQMTNEIFTVPDPDEYNCVKSRFGVCPVLEYCDAGKNFICNPEEITFEGVEDAIIE